MQDYRQLFVDCPLNGQVPHPRVELSVVLPCLNEEATVGKCVGKAINAMQRLNIKGEVIVVDNGSNDNSCTVATMCGASVVRQTDKGYGSALRKGFEHAQGAYILMADADDSYDLSKLDSFLLHLRCGSDLVMGNRFKGGIKPGAMPWHHRWIGNPVLSGIVRVLFRAPVGDCHCGMRAFKKSAFKNVPLQMPGMEFASEMVIKATMAKMQISEVPIILWPDGRGRSPHLRSFRDGWRHLRLILMYCPWFLFIVPGLVLTLGALFVIGNTLWIGYGKPAAAFGPNFLFGMALMAITGSHILLFGVLARLCAHFCDPVFSNDRVENVLSYISVERGICAGLLIAMIGAGFAGSPLTEWWRHNTVSSPGLWVLGATLITLGVEVIFGTFLIAVVELVAKGPRTQ